jgi:N-acyl-D-amino-acid deacylase
VPHDLVIRGGLVVDGCGGPRRRADIAVSGGRITAVGEVEGTARETIDASDCIVAPGFIDPHTHYDAQICWDPEMTPSSWHGVTSVVMGNCGVGLAPCRPEAREIAARDLVNVEGIPFDVLDRGITWDWESFPSYMHAAAARQSALNLAFLAPLTPFRHYVMGGESMERAASAEETAQIASLIGEAIDAGAFGFSTTTMNQHLGYGGRPLACRNSSHDELMAYSRVLASRGRGVVQIALTRQLGVLDDSELALLEDLLDASGRPVTFIAMFDRDDMPDASRDSLRKMSHLVSRGARAQISPLPLTREIDMRSPFSFAAFPSFKRVFADKTKSAQAAVYADPVFRAQFREDLKRPAAFGNWERIRLHHANDPGLKPLEGQSIAEIARAQGADPVDVFFDITLRDDLTCEFSMTSFNTRIERMSEMLNQPETLIGLGDAGAHVDMLCDAGYPTYLLGTWVRERQALSLERAVERLSAEPADYFGIRDRGRLLPGLAADITVFDPAGIGSAARMERRYDLPGGAKRMVIRSQGIEHTLVNGVPVWSNGATTGRRPGGVLRSTFR